MKLFVVEVIGDRVEDEAGIRAHEPRFRAVGILEDDEIAGDGGEDTELQMPRRFGGSRDFVVRIGGHKFLVEVAKGDCGPVMPAGRNVLRADRRVLAPERSHGNGQQIPWPRWCAADQCYWAFEA